MANTTFNTRIQNKVDSYENWKLIETSFIPLKGEICIATVSTQEGGVQSPPQTLIKIGDGKTTFQNLKWLSATAADVIDSLKGTNPTLPATSITGLNDYISGQIQDTNTQYRLIASGTMGIQLQSKEKGEEDTAFKNVGAPITLVPPTYSLIPGDTNGTVKFGVVGEESEVAVTGLKSGAYVDMASLALAEVSCGNTEVIGTIKQENGIVTATKKTLTANDIPSIPTSKVTNLDTTLAGKQDTLVFNTPYNSATNKAATMADVQNSIEGLSGAMHYIGESTTNPAEGTVTIEAKPEYSPAAGDVVTYQKKEFVYDGEAWRELGDESSFAVKGSIKNADIASDANIAQSKIAGLEAALAAKATPADITSAIEGLDVAITNVSTGNKITSIEEVDGKIQVSTGAITAEDIPAIGQEKVTGLTDALNLKADKTVTDGLNTRLETAEDEIDTLQTQIANKADKTEVATVNTRIDNLDNNDVEVDGQFVASAVQTNGLVAVTRKKVNIAKLEQTSGEYIIFNCGNASTNV